MALNRIDYPTSPIPLEGNDDWNKIVDIMNAAIQNLDQPIGHDDTNILEGALFHIGGSIYSCDADTAISGDSADYIYVEGNTDDDGETATAYFSDSLTGVAWNSTWGGFYDEDGKGNKLYLINDITALQADIITSVKTMMGMFYESVMGQSLTTDSDVTFAGITLADAGYIEGATTVEGAITFGSGFLPTLTSTGSFTIAAGETHYLEQGLYCLYWSDTDTFGEWYSETADDWVYFTDGFVASAGNDYTKIVNEGSNDVTVVYNKY